MVYYIQMRIGYESVDWLSYEVKSNGCKDSIVDCCGYWLVIGSDDFLLYLAKHKDRRRGINYSRQRLDCNNYSLT
jgi:hypothetical protein